MDIFYYILFGTIFVTGIIIILIILSKLKKLQKTINEKEDKIKDLNYYLKTANSDYTRLLDERSMLQSQVSKLNSDLRKAWEGNGDGKLIEERKNEIERLGTQISELTTLSLEKTSKLEELEAQSQKLLQDIGTLSLAKENSAADVKVLESSVSKIVNVLNQCASSYREALLKSSNAAKISGELIELSEKEDRLIKLIDELKDNYAELVDDFAAIEWKKVWLPKAKVITSVSEADGTSGIYKLTLVSDPDVCYIGQAVDIKERWYQHMKKMVGADKKGNEKLYNRGYNPSDFSWEILEKLSSNKDLLDERELYWINFYAAYELGLNSKKGNLN